ncbi:MAG: hypothetical protein CML14_04900 [Puniceicoccaceae bacterium]|nr:hypothetical protein [Puniceicoccaceae bacterium]|tara:strand:+ start:1131 stop:1346 length:216 start_codon:yes stop_codon:yes gene_type:complete
MNLNFLAEKKEKNRGESSLYSNRFEEEEHSMLIPRIKNESDQKRAERILEQMKSSSERLDRILSVFERINR